MYKKLPWNKRPVSLVYVYVFLVSIQTCMCVCVCVSVCHACYSFTFGQRDEEPKATLRRMKRNFFLSFLFNTHENRIIQIDDHEDDDDEDEDDVVRVY